MSTSTSGVRPAAGKVKTVGRVEAAPFVNERSSRERRLAQIDEGRFAGTLDLEPAYERARLLDALGRDEAAHAAYREILGRDSGHAGALNDFGRLLDRTGYHRAARTVYARAVEVRPDDPAGHGNLAGAFLDDGDIGAARRHYDIVLALDPDNVAAHQCMAILQLRLGEVEAAAAHARIGFRAGATVWPYRGTREPISVLVLHSALGGNVPIDRFLPDTVFAKLTAIVEFFPAGSPLPPHAFVVNAIGDASRCRDALKLAQALLSQTAAPVVNPPERITQTGRETAASRLTRLAGVIAPLTLRFPRSRLAGPEGAACLEAAGFTWPVIVRSPGFQTGLHCVLAGGPEQLTRAVSELPGDELFAIQFIDVRGADANVRKYRVMIVDGTIYPLHLAIDGQWMVHYFRAGMAARPDFLAEEAAFLTAMRDVLGVRTIALLEAIAARLGLDYGGIDFALDPRGRIVVFEANATMIVPPSSAEAEGPRRVALERIEGAVDAMLRSRAVAARR